MKAENVETSVSSRLPLKRFEHVVRVAETAKKLAVHYNESPERVELAALLHDIAKFVDKESLREQVVSHQIDPRLLSYHHELWHGPVGAIIAKEQYQIEDQAVLDAIYYHTTGRAGMNPIEKIVYIADLIEPGRKFPGVEQLREPFPENLDELLANCVQHTLQFLLTKRAPIFPDSLACYNELMMKRR